MAEKHRNKRLKPLITIGIALLVLATAAGTGAIYIDRSGAISHDKTLYIYHEMTYGELVDTLTADGVLRNPAIFGFYAKLMGFNSGSVRSGRYHLSEGLTTRRVINILRGGIQTPVTLTVNNIRTLPQLAGRLSRQLKADSLDFLQALMSPDIHQEYGFNKNTFIAMFIPNSYQVYWTATPTEIIERMHREFDKFWNEDRMSLLAATGLTRTEAITLASIVYEETKKNDEMPTVAGVYMNRMRKGMKLEADPTVKFAIGDFTIKRVRNTRIDSPYNTYMYAGLPPGPICMPSIAAIDGVLNYGKHNYLFFCASPDFSGYHRFAKTFEEHLRNANAYWKALNEAGIR